MSADPTAQASAMDKDRTHSEASTMHGTHDNADPAAANDSAAASSDASERDVEKASPAGDAVNSNGNNGTSDSTEKPKAGPPPGMDPKAFPDGGRKAWLTVLGGFCAMFVSFGWINAIGIWQTYYSTTLLSSYGDSTVAWIISLQSFLMLFGGPFIGKLFDSFGPTHLMIVGTFLHVFGLMMASLSTQYYQILLSQGVCSPIGASCIFYPAISAITTWFLRRRALAMGISVAGSSLGGVLFPIIITQLLPEVGFAWTMRIVAFIILALAIVACVTVRSRIEHRPSGLSFRALVRPLTEPAFRTLTIGCFLVFLGMFIPFAFIPLTAASWGMDPTLASYLISILNAASIFGRIIPGHLGDRYGRFNVVLSMLLLSGILTLALWLPARGNAPNIVFAALYGFGTGSFVSMTPALIAMMSDIREIGLRQGVLYLFSSFAVLIGNPIAGALVARDDGGYTYLQVFTGLCFLIGTSVIFAARQLVTKNKLFIQI